MPEPLVGEYPNDVLMAKMYGVAMTLLTLVIKQVAALARSKFLTDFGCLNTPTLGSGIFIWCAQHGRTFSWSNE